jgi:hypothetical protein
MRVLFILLCLGLFNHALSQNFITPSVVTTLITELNETSGLVNLNGEIWTHNDNGGLPELYQINLTDGSILRTVNILDANNKDWEDIACDETYVYIGDFGNNDGSRTNLRIYRVSRSDIVSSNEVNAEKIQFSYSDQTSFEPSYHNTNFDCEALISFQDKLYLFTKNWIDNKTKVYELSKNPGTHIAQYLATFDVNCLITGAEIIPSINTLLLSGYNQSGGTYTWIFNNFSGANFFGGNNTKLIWTMLTQVEGICYVGSNQAYASSEKYAGTLDATLYSLDLSGYMTQVDVAVNQQIQIFVDHSNIVIVAKEGQNLTGTLQILTLDGQVVAHQKIRNESVTKIPFNLSAGTYLARYQEGTFLFTRKLIIF